MKDLVIIKELDALVVFSKGGAKSLVDRVRDEVMDEVYDLSTIKGRKRIASRAFDVSKSKTALDNFGKDLADQLNAKLKPINVERKYARDELDKLRDEVRQPLTDWEDEQKEIEAAKQAEKEAAELAIQVANDQEMALLLDDKFNADAKAAEEKRALDLIAYEEGIRAKAALEATRLAEEKAAQETQRIENEKAELIRKEQRAILEKEQAQEREKQLTLNAIAAEKQKVIDDFEAQQKIVDAAVKAEARRLADIETAKQNQIAAQQQEQARLAAEQKARDEDKEHRRAKNKAAVSAIMESTSLNQEQARNVIGVIVGGLIPDVKLTY